MPAANKHTLKKIKRPSSKSYGHSYGHGHDHDDEYKGIDLEEGHGSDDQLVRMTVVKNRKRELETKYGSKESSRESSSEKKKIMTVDIQKKSKTKNTDTPNSVSASVHDRDRDRDRNPNPNRSAFPTKRTNNGKSNFDGEKSITINDLEQSKRTKNKTGSNNNSQSKSTSTQPLSLSYSFFSSEHTTSNSGSDIDGKSFDLNNKKRAQLKRRKSSMSVAHDSFSLNNSSGETSKNKNKNKTETETRSKQPSTGKSSQKLDQLHPSSMQFERSRSNEGRPGGKFGHADRQKSRKIDHSRSTKSPQMTKERSSEQQRAGVRSQQSSRRGEIQRSRSYDTGTKPLRTERSMDLSSANVGDTSAALNNRQGQRRREIQRSNSYDPAKKHSRATRGTSLQRRRSTDRSLAGFSVASSTRVSRGEPTRTLMTKSGSKGSTRLSTMGHRSREIQYDEFGRRFVRGKKKKDKEKLPRTLVLIWVIVAAELGFDLATTVIAFLSFVKEANCCEKPIELVLGNIPLGTTIPFFALVMVELIALIRVIILTLWPSLSSDDGNNDDDVESADQSSFRRYCCYCLKMKAKALMGILQYLVLLNPIFGCMIAWILMYQSDKKESFVVLGLEGASLILHFASVCLEGSFRTYKQVMFHSTPLIPFFVSIGMVGYYLKQGGVCYVPKEKLFRFSGCEICNFTGVPKPCPKDFSDLWSVDDVPKSLGGVWDEISQRSNQSTYCSAEVDFCFFSY